MSQVKQIYTQCAYIKECVDSFYLKQLKLLKANASSTLRDNRDNSNLKLPVGRSTRILIEMMKQ